MGMSTQMLHAGISRHALIAVSGALAAGWLLTACGNGDDSVTDNQTTTETTETTSETTDGENTIEVPSPDIDVPSPDMPSVDVPSPEMPEVTPSPVP
jgi:hypothetical protein